MSDLFRGMKNMLPKTTPSQRGVSWVIAGVAFYAWYEIDKRRKFSTHVDEEELKKINSEVKRRETSRRKKKKKKEEKTLEE